MVKRIKQVAENPFRRLDSSKPDDEVDSLDIKKDESAYPDDDYLRTDDDDIVTPPGKHGPEESEKSGAKD